MKINIKSKEILAVLAVMLGVIILQWDLWITRKLMFTGDSITWFGVFSYFSDCLQQGVLPLWNPYMNCGEIFFLNIDVLHLWDPSTLFLVFVGKFLRIDTLTTYHFDLLFRYLIFISGSYLFFRRVAKYKISAFVAFITLTFSALCSSYLKQHGFVICYYQLPWILLFTFKFFEEKDRGSLLWLAFLWGITIYTGYHAMYMVSSVTILLVGIYLSKGFVFAKEDGFVTKRKFFIGAILIFLLLSANLLPVFWTYTSSTVPTVKMFEAPLGAPSYPADFFSLLAPYSFWMHLLMLYFSSAIPMSESFLYIGLIPIFFAIVGLFYSRHRYKIGFAFSLGLTTLLMLGPKFFVMKLFSDFFPFFSIIRNTHIFGAFFIFCLVYFTCIGVDVVLELAKNIGLSRYRFRFILIAFIISAGAFLITYYVLRNYLLVLHEYPDVCENISSLIKQDLATMLKGMFLRSYYNAFLFIISIVIIFYIIEKAKINLKVKYFVIISLILIDLINFNLVMYYGLTTAQRIDMSLWSKDSVLYNNYRELFIWPRYPFLGFGPAIQRKFSAVSSRIPWVTTHFYEMKDYFKFVDNNQIPEAVKNVFMGISTPKLKLINAAVVLPAGQQVEEYKKLNENAVNCAIFIEKELPAKFQRLRITTEKINQANIGKGAIKVLRFDPNSLSLEVDPEQDSFLYYSDGFDKSWRAFIDGKDTKIYRTNMAFKSVILEKGKHLVRFVYDPILYKITLFCYFTGILVVVITLIYRLLKRWNIH